MPLNLSVIIKFKNAQCQFVKKKRHSCFYSDFYFEKYYLNNYCNSMY